MEETLSQMQQRGFTPMLPIYVFWKLEERQGEKTDGQMEDRFISPPLEKSQPTAWESYIHQQS